MAKERDRISDPCPNEPSFDFNPETGLPNLRRGETVIRAIEVAGVPVYTTDGGRNIHVCSIDEFEAKFHGLHRAHVWAFYYPHATGKIKRHKVRALEQLAKSATVSMGDTGGGGGVDE